MLRSTHFGALLFHLARGCCWSFGRREETEAPRLPFVQKKTVLGTLLVLGRGRELVAACQWPALSHAIMEGRSSVTAGTPYGGCFFEARKRPHCTS